MRRLLACCLVAVAAACSTSDARPSLATANSAPTSATRPNSAPATLAPVPTTTAVSSAGLVTAACAGRLKLQASGDLPLDLDEVSGIAASRHHKGILWVIEDSGNPAVVTGIGYDGSVRARLKLSAAPNIDWEDIAVGPGPGGRDSIYVADIGDNFFLRSSVTIYRFDEPDEIADATIPARSIEKIEGRYIAGAVDAEAMFVNSAGAIWVIAKVASGPATLYALDRARGELRPSGDAFDLGSEQVTAADLTPDGRALFVRTYGSLRMFVLAGAPDGLRERMCVLRAPPESQGESVTVGADGRSLVTVSEATRDEHVQLHVYTYDG